MSRRRSAPVVAVIDWRAAAPLKDNAGLLQRAGLLEAARPRRRAGPDGSRSLVVRADGTGELQRFTAATAARRIALASGARITRKTGMGQRG